MSLSELRRWENYCATLSWKHGQLDRSSYLAFLRAASLGMTQDFAFSRVIERLRRARAPRRRPDKITAQLVRAYAYVTGHGNGHSKKTTRGERAHRRAPSRTCRAIDFEVVDYLVMNGPGLGEISGLPGARIWPAQESRTEEIIDALFPGNPLLCVGFSQSRFITEQREKLRGTLGKREFIVPNPMKARRGRTKAGHLSEHSLDNTGPRRFLVIEFDFKEHDRNGLATKWTPWIQKWKLEGKSVFDAAASLLFNLTAGTRGHPLTLIVHSGNKSLHGWFYCLGEHEGRLHAFMRRAVRLGADPQTWVRSQFVRMPDGRRVDGRRQTVWYFNPETND